MLNPTISLPDDLSEPEYQTLKNWVASTLKEYPEIGQDPETEPYETLLKKIEKNEKSKRERLEEYVCVVVTDLLLDEISAERKDIYTQGMYLVQLLTLLEILPCVECCYNSFQYLQPKWRITAQSDTWLDEVAKQVPSIKKIWYRAMACQQTGNAWAEVWLDILAEDDPKEQYEDLIEPAIEGILQLPDAEFNAPPDEPQIHTAIIGFSQKWCEHEKYQGWLQSFIYRMDDFYGCSFNQKIKEKKITELKKPEIFEAIYIQLYKDQLPTKPLSNVVTYSEKVLPEEQTSTVNLIDQRKKNYG